MRNLRLATAALATFAVTACSSGGGTPSTPVAIATPASGTTSGSAPTGATQTGGTLAFSLKIYHPVGSGATTAAVSRRSPNYVSIAAQSVIVTLTPTGGTATTTPLDIGTSAFSCAQTGEFEICTTNLFAPASGTLAVSAYDAKQNGQINTPPNGNLLGSATTPFTTAPGTSTPVDVILNGQPAKAALYLSNPSPAVGTAVADQIFAVVTDADGYLIVGTFTTPVTITDGSGAADLTIAGSTAAAAPSVALSSSSTTAVVNYGGSATPGSITYTPSGGGAATFVAATLTPTSAAPGQKIYAIGMNPAMAGGQAVNVYDLSTAVKGTTTGSTVNYSVANTLDSFHLSTGGSSALTNTQFAVSPTGIVEWTYESPGGGEAEALYTYPALPVPAAAGGATVVANAQTYTFTTPGNGANSAVSYEPNGTTILVPVAGLNGNNRSLGRFPVFANSMNLPPIVTFSLSDDFGGGGGFIDGNGLTQFDPLGNLWVAGFNGLDEYKASDVANATQGQVLQAVTQITYGNATGQLVNNNIQQIAFAVTNGAISALYVACSGNVYEYPGTVIGATAAQTGIQFTPQYAANGIATDPSSANIIVTGNNDLEYYLGLAGQYSNGSSQTPYKRVTLPLGASGQIYFDK